MRVFFLLIAFMLSPFAFADADFIIRDGKIISPLSDYNSNGLRRYYNLTDGCYGVEYCAKHDTNRSVRDAMTGARSTAPVPATVRQSVPKQSVFKGLLENAKKAKKGLGGWPMLACMLICDKLADQGYEWMAEAQDFVKSSPGAREYCFSDSNGSNIYSSGSPVCSVLHAPFSNTDERNHVSALCDRWVSQKGINMGSFGNKFDYCQGYDSAGRWFSSSNIQVRSISTVALTQSEFDRIIQPHADSNPSEYVNLSRPEQNAPVPGVSTPVVTVPTGTVATTSAYTNPVTGKAEQKKFTFNTTNNITRVSTTIIERPDLEPGSEAAPLGQEVPETETAPGGESPPPPETPDFCEKNPDVLACQKMGEPKESMFDDISIPHITENVLYSPDRLFPQTGVCPQPKTFNVAGRQVALSYDPICGFLENIRFAVLAGFIVVSMGIAFGSLRGNK